jgi:Flp pilus assembly protein TadG
VKTKIFGRAGEQGQAAWEFLLVLPIFIIVMLLLVDFGIWMYEYVSVANAVREGARYGAVTCAFANQCGSTPSQVVSAIKQRVVNRSGGMLTNPNEVFVAWVNRNGGNNYERGDSIVVWVNHTYNMLFFPANLGVVSCADMMLEQTYTVTGMTSDPNPPCGG